MGQAPSSDAIVIMITMRPSTLLVPPDASTSWQLGPVATSTLVDSGLRYLRFARLEAQEVSHRDEHALVHVAHLLAPGGSFRSPLKDTICPSKALASDAKTTHNMLISGYHSGFCLKMSLHFKHPQTSKQHTGEVETCSHNQV